MLAPVIYSVCIWTLMIPFILWLGIRLPLRQPHFWRNSFFHLLLSILSGIVQHYVYLFGLLAVNILTIEAFRLNLFNLTLLSIFIYTLIARYTAVIGIQQAYLYFRESQERAFRLQEAELQMLKMQLHPHFFFNTLNAISALIYRSPVEADRMITQLGDLFRVSLRKDKAREIRFSEELEFLKTFLQIHRTLMGKRLQIEYKIEPDTLAALVPNLILQPLAENAIQHGIEHLEEGGRITFCAAKKNETLYLEVRDNGIGLFSPNGNNNGGIGLSNTRARLENLYPNAHKFSIEEQKGGGVSVKIEIPFRDHLTEENEY